MRRTFDLSTGLVAIGAIAVLASLFLEWYTPGLRAWDVFEIADWALAALAVGALVVLAGEATAAVPPTQRLAWICGIVALIVIAELLDPPPAARDATREIGAWVALGGSAAMVAGVVLAMAQISVTIDVAERERRRRTAAVDARSGEGAASGSRPADASSDDDRDAAADPPSARGRDLWRSVAGGDTAAGDEPPARDPDRTQPLSPVDRPNGEA